MSKIKNIICLAATAAVVVGCEQSSTIPYPTTDEDRYISFSASTTPLTVTTKSEIASEESTDFGRFVVETHPRVGDQSATRVSGTSFSEDDCLGIYMYYNYWFASYSESVIFNNQQLIAGTDKSLSLPNNIHRLWTFSSIGGDAPFHLQAMSYYPYEADVTLSESTEDSAATLSWEYNSEVDLLLAYTQIAYWQDGVTGEENQGVRFKDYLLTTLDGEVELEFKHLLAEITFFPFKASSVSDEITIQSISINYTAPTSYSLDSNAGTETWSGSNGGEITIDVTTPATLTTTESELILEKPIYLPPTSVINSVKFVLTVGSEDKTYYWHPHIEDMTAKSYEIHFELDPDRNN